jgi:hypothetical protein
MKSMKKIKSTWLFQIYEFFADAAKFKGSKPVTAGPNKVVCRDGFRQPLMNPGLEALCVDEAERRFRFGFKERMTPPSTPPRGQKRYKNYFCSETNFCKRPGNINERGSSLVQLTPCCL